MWKIMTLIVFLSMILGINQNNVIDYFFESSNTQKQESYKITNYFKITNPLGSVSDFDNTLNPNFVGKKPKRGFFNKAIVLPFIGFLEKTKIQDLINTFYSYESKLYFLKNKLSFHFEINNIFEPKPHPSLNNPATKFNDNKTETSNMLTATEDKLKIARFRLIFYALLITLAIVSSFLVLIYLKRNSNLKYTRELEEKNQLIQIQNTAFAEQTKHLENANTVKDKLFGIISHDLKDSITAINGLIDLLKDGTLSREEFYSLIPDLSENANSACLLLFNLLHWSKSQMNALKPKPHLFNVQEVIEEKFNLFKQRTKDKGISLIDNSKTEFVYADRSMFEIVIQNLLANALKFSKAGDSITISTNSKKDACIVSIADTGVGISKENIEKLFKNDYFTTRGTNNEKGTGLGLPICKELSALNKGEIWVESTPGVGSTFYVELPKHEPSS